MELCTYFNGSTTTIFIYSFEDSTCIPSDVNEILTFSYSGDEPQLLDAEAGGYHGESVILTTYNNSVLDANDGEDFVPTEFSLHQNYPNPFNPNTEIRFDLPSRSEWSCEIFNISGQQIKQIKGNSSAGTVSFEWNGTDENGNNVASGIYFYRINAGEFSDTKKMILLK